MDDQFFSLDSLLSDAYVGALNEGRWVYSQLIHVIRCGISTENNQ